MSRLIIRSTAVGLSIVALVACASENLQTTGVEPSSTVNPASPQGPASMSPVTPGENPNQPAPAGEPNAPAGMNGSPVSEGNPQGIAPPVLDPSGDMTNGDDSMANPAEGPAADGVVLTPAEVGGDLEGYLLLAPCESQDFGHDCTLPGCQGGAKTIENTLRLGGEVGTIYDVTVRVYGVVEPRVYQGGVRRAGNNFDVNGRDFWHEGGVIPANAGTYNSYELHVEPAVPGAPNVYYLNSRTGGDTPLLVRLDYEATFPVQGAGTIRFRSFDLNCRQITNCATAECGPLTPKPLTQDTVINADPPPGASFTQPYQTGANVGRGQWVYFDVLDIAARP